MNPLGVVGLPIAACCVALGARSARETRIAERLAIGRSSATRLPTLRRDDVVWFVVAGLIGR